MVKLVILLLAVGFVIVIALLLTHGHSSDFSM